MPSLKHLLQDADPVRHEAPRLDAARERIRSTMLQSAPIDRPAQSLRARLTLTAALTLAVIGVAALGYQVWVNGATPVQAAVRFEVRLAEKQPTPGLVVAQIADSRELIYLHPEVVVNNDDIEASWVYQDGPGFGVAVRFLPSGAERMKQATAARIGRPVAILVDGAVVMAPIIHRSTIRR
jgi:preprotein translocase subunit SecD